MTAYSQSPSGSKCPCDGYCYTATDDSLAIECQLTKAKKDSIIKRRDIQKSRLDSLLNIAVEDRDEYKAGYEGKIDEVVKCAKDLEKARKSTKIAIIGAAVGVIVGWFLRKGAVQ